MTADSRSLEAAQEEFVAKWGSLGPIWGITRSMAQVHAVLLASEQPQTTDEVMAALQISRGNANTHLRELIAWGLVRRVHRKGERKEFFEAEKHVWKIFCIIARERKRREIDPALETLRECCGQTKGLRAPEAKRFHTMVCGMADFVGVASNVLDRASARQESQVIPTLLKLFR